MSATLPTTFPTTHPTTDLFETVTVAFEQTGIMQTITGTPWWGWTIAACGVFIGLFLGRVVSSVLMRFSTRAAEKVRLYRAVILSSIAGPLNVIFFNAGPGIALSQLNMSPNVRLFALSVFQLIYIVSIGWMLYNLVDLLALLLTRWSRGRQGNLSVMLVPLARKTLRVLLVTIFLLFIAENVFKQDVKALLAGLGIAGLAVSLAAQDSIKNFFGSIMIFADQPFAIGDSIKVDSAEGTVEDIGFRSTRIRTAEGFLITVPNGKLNDSVILNQSKRKSIRRTFDIALPSDTKPAKVEQAIEIVKGVLADPAIAAAFDMTNSPPRVALDEMTTTHMRLRIFYWYRTADYWKYLEHAERLNLLIVKRFAQADIAFATSAAVRVLNEAPSAPASNG